MPHHSPLAVAPATTGPTRRRLVLATGGAALLGALAPHPARAQPRRLVFATNWKAQAAHGGFYQALADGSYERHGLAVEIRPGGPQVNNRPLLPAGRIDFLMTGNLLHSFDNVKNGVPVIVVAAMFQKDPQALMAHPGQGYERFADLVNAPTVYVAKDAQFSWWAWLKAVHGFSDERLKPYTYNLGPFLANKRSVQQGYAVEEPLAIQRAGGFEPLSFLLADQGYSTYSTTIETRRSMVEEEPELVRRFVEASVLGWATYLHGDRSAGDALIKRDNPEMSDELIAGSVALIKQLGLVDSGEATTRGIGALSSTRIRDFYEQMVKAGLYQPGEVDLSRVASLRFVNEGYGLDLRKRLGAGR